MKFFLSGCITTLLLIAVGAYVLLDLGLFSFRADQTPSGFEQKYATQALDASTRRQAPDIKNPIPATDANLLEAMKLYKTNCTNCHGDPGDPKPIVGSSFYPPVPRFMENAPDCPRTRTSTSLSMAYDLRGCPAGGIISATINFGN